MYKYFEHKTVVLLIKYVCTFEYFTTKSCVFTIIMKSRFILYKKKKICV